MRNPWIPAVPQANQVRNSCRVMLFIFQLISNQQTDMGVMTANSEPLWGDGNPPWLRNPSLVLSLKSYVSFCIVGKIKPDFAISEKTVEETIEKKR